MFKLRQTWTPFFTNLCLYNVDTRAHDIDRAWPITARVPDPPPFASNIHLNLSFAQRVSNSIDRQLTIECGWFLSVLEPGSIGIAIRSTAPDRGGSSTNPSFTTRGRRFQYISYSHHRSATAIVGSAETLGIIFASRLLSDDS